MNTFSFRRFSAAALFVVSVFVVNSFVRAEEASKPPGVSYDQAKDVIYNNDVDGIALVMDVFTPKGEHNGLGIVDVASGAWYSDRGKIRDHEQAQLYQIFCARGYTVFAPRPGSITKFTGQEILANVKRAIRWVKLNSGQYKIDPSRLGLTGASAGGHLASLAGVTADEGNKEAKDPINRESSKVKAVSVFFPPTDFMAWGAGKVMARATMKGLFFDGGNFAGKSEEEINEALRKISPAQCVTAGAPPFLIFHGTKDPMVPMAQSEILVKALKDKGCEAELTIKEGGGHPWPTINEEVKVMADWFDKQLKR